MRDATRRARLPGTVYNKPVRIIPKGPAMTSNPANGSTRYGVVTCGKPFPGPLDLGPCRLEPEHAGQCEWRAIGGRVRITEGPPLPADVERHIEQTRQYRDRSRRAYRVALVCALINMAAAAYSLVNLFT